MARRTLSNHWFISVETPRQSRLLVRRGLGPARQTKTFPTEAEAKQYAKELPSDGNNKIIAGTLLSAHQPARRIISGSQLYIAGLRKKKPTIQLDGGVGNLPEAGIVGG